MIVGILWSMAKLAIKLVSEYKTCTGCMFLFCASDSRALDNALGNKRFHPLLCNMFLKYSNYVVMVIPKMIVKRHNKHRVYAASGGVGGDLRVGHDIHDRWGWTWRRCLSEKYCFCPLPFLLLLPYHPMHGKSFLCCPRKEKDTCISCFMLSVFGYLFATLSLYFYLSTCSTFVSHLLISSTMLEPHRWHLYVFFLTTCFTLDVLFNMLLFSPL